MHNAGTAACLLKKMRAARFWKPGSSEESGHLGRIWGRCSVNSGHPYLKRPLSECYEIV